MTEPSNCCHEFRLLEFINFIYSGRSFSCMSEANINMLYVSDISSKNFKRGRRDEEMRSIKRL